MQNEFEILREPCRVELRRGGRRTVFFGITPDIIRCVCTEREEISQASALDIMAEAGEPLTVQETAGAVTVSAGRLSVQVSRETGHFTWTDLSSGRVLLKEAGHVLRDIPVYVYTTGGEEPVIRRVRTVDGDRNFVENLKAEEDHRAYEARVCFDFAPEEQIHGLGQGEEGVFNYRGRRQYLYQHNMRIPCPWILSDRMYGVLFDCGSLMEFCDTEEGSYMQLDTVPQLDYYVVSGGSVDQIIRGFRELTGRAVMLPRWAFGYIQSKERYVDQQEVISVASKYRELGVGLDCVVQDWKTWSGDNWGEKLVDKERFPDISAMNQALHDMHVHSMVSVWPNMNFDTVDCTEMREKGFLLNDLATYDAFDRDARALYWKQADRELFSGGYDSWWCDSTEPFSGPDWGGETRRSEEERFRLVGGEHKKFLGAERANLYAKAHARGIYENQKKQSEKRVLNLTRSGYPGIQRFGTVLWSGDITAAWDTMRKQLTEGLNMSLSGLPYWTLDIGGFFAVHENWQARGCGCGSDPTPKWFWQGQFEEGVKDPGFRELYVRWLEFGAFLPMFRSHGTDTPREIWNFGAPGDMFYDAIRDTIALRYRLMPYIYSLAGQVHLEHGSMQRPLLSDFAEDSRAAACDREYMFGRALLVCPVTEPMYFAPGGSPLHAEKTWQCYLPAGTGWYDLRSGAYYEGGQEITAEAPIGYIPLFARAGSIIPMEQCLIYADQAADTPFEIHIYPGADGSFRYYEDAGDGYGYERGEYNVIQMDWKDKEGLFSISGGSRDFAGGLKGRTCRIICGGECVEFVWQGEAAEISLH